ncbi:ester cyclase [Agrobacterium sp. BA1120]|uniref:ester cyclase n=1 Tax=Agrobacterium sp. BA1120 TaxID=3228927 RepID=UPI00336A620F
MNDHQLREIYLAYLGCLNRQAWDELGNFVDDQVEHNGRPIGLDGYRDMLVKDFRDIPDLSFQAELLVCEPAKIAARLNFDCSPVGDFMGLPINGKRVVFHEHVFYEFRGKKIRRVWSVIDKAEI